MKIENIDTLEMIDHDSGDNVFVFIRATKDHVSICLSKEDNGDIEVLIERNDCKSLVEQLINAISVAEKLS